jgi:hypothetical protein
MPTTRNEEYRFTDVEPLTSAKLARPAAAAVVDAALLEGLRFPEAAGCVAVLVDGVLQPELSDLDGGLPRGAYVGGAAGAPAAALERLVGPLGVRGQKIGRGHGEVHDVG